MKKEPSICQSLPCLDLVSFLVLNRIKPLALLLVVPFRQSLHVSDFVTIILTDAQTDSQLDPSWLGLRPFPRVKGSYLRLDIKGPESMPDGMGCHLPMKLREQNPCSQRLTRIQFCCIPQVAPRHSGNDCQIRWSVSVSSLLIITMASTLNGRIDPTSHVRKNVAELLLQHLFGLGTDVDRPRRCATW